MANRITYPKFKAFTSAGVLAAGYKVYTYEAGTTDALETYTTAAGTTANDNPVTLNAAGEADIFVSESAKLVLKDADDVTIWTVDNIDPTTVTAAEVSSTAFSDVVATNVQDALEELKGDIEAKADPDDVVDTGFGEMPTGIVMQGFIGGDASLDTDSDHDIAFAPFLCKNSTNEVVIYSTSTITKQVDAAWAAGDDAGGMLTGTVAANTCYLWVAMGDGSTGVDIGFLALASIGDIATHVTAAGFSYYKIFGFRHTDASANWTAFQNTGPFCLSTVASENVISNGITTSYATVTHTNHIAEDYTELICYGVRDASEDGTGSGIIASDDGTNNTMFIGRPNGETDDTSVNAWAFLDTNIQWVPYSATREFISRSGTVDLLLHGVKFRR